MEESSLLASVHRAGICHSHNQRQKVISILIQLWILNPACCTRDFSATNPHWYDSGTNTIGVTSHFLIGRKAHYRRWNPYIPDTVNKAKSLWLNPKSLMSPRRKTYHYYCYMDKAIELLLITYKVTLLSVQNSISVGTVGVGKNNQTISYKKSTFNKIQTF